MKRFTFLFLFFVFAGNAYGQNEIIYTLTHTPGTDQIQVEINLDSMKAENVKLVIPRSAPGTYELSNYLEFVDNVQGHAYSNMVLKGLLGDGSYFIFDSKEEHISKITYLVDIKKMENTLLGAFATSKLRTDYLGLLGYSVFGFVEGLEDQPITLHIKTGSDWPIFSTLKPKVIRNYGEDTYKTENFANLVDAQYLLGNDVQIYKVSDADIPLFVAAYSETPIDIEEIGRRGNVALDGLNDYFGYTPMPHYTMCYEFLKPLSSLHNYGFSMEHLNSMSASMDTSRAITGYDPEARMSTIVHHIGHSWLPLRSYGKGYRPFEWQTAPLIETIWLNEGFIWYVANYHVLKDKDILNFFHKVIDDAPNYINEKSLKDLSLLGSTQYALDFRIGKNLFSRGALLAYELDELIKKETNGSNSFKDAILGLLNWSAENQKAFEYQEILEIMSSATDVDLSPVWDKWQQPLK